ncbi:VOC family protein [Roseibium sp. HPY-6]|uniref:VOC family protein n=1 Tax=Roseibium sp. HPY-6 TaxID=3229852 RepID=UPI00338FB529
MFYQDPDTALTWLEAAFGLTRLIDVRDNTGGLVHAEMRFGNCSIIVDGEWPGFVSSPQSLEGMTTQIVYVQIESGLDEHCARALEHGADIISNPEDQYYGDRIYRAKDLEGHIWTFSQAVRRVGRAESDRLGGVRISGWHSE